MEKVLNNKYAVLSVFLTAVIAVCAVALVTSKEETLNDVTSHATSSLLLYEEEKKILEDMQLESVSAGLAILWDENGLYCEGMLPVNLTENSPLIPVTRQDHVRFASADGVVWINGTSFAPLDYTEGVEPGVARFNHEDDGTYILNLIKQVSADQCLVGSGEYSLDKADTYAEWYDLLNQTIAVGNSVLCFGPMQTPVSDIILYDGTAQVTLLDTNVLVSVCTSDLSDVKLETVNQIGEFQFQTSEQFQNTQAGMNTYFVPLDGYYLEIIAPNTDILVTLFGNIAA